MQPFKLHHISLSDDGPHFLLLPRLNQGQEDLIAARLVELGHAVTRSGILAGRRGSVLVRVNSNGVCWSNEDPTDLIAPIIPRVLTTPKQPVPHLKLSRRYVGLLRRGRGAVFRFSLRMELSRWWRELRAADQSALAPDEYDVAAFFLSHTEGECRLLTDFPSENFQVRRIGKRQYYESRIDAKEAARFLRPVGSKGQRNAYLPSSGVLEVDSFAPPGPTETRQLLSGLGDWSGFSIRTAD